MTLRDGTTAGTALKSPFLCIICFDEFNLKDQFPVVLPCGHTHVCNICANRLQRCMECREPLFMAPPKRSPIDNEGVPLMHLHHRRNRNLIYQHPKCEVIRLPLPKNFVLMDMIEAVERQQKDGELPHGKSDRMSGVLTVTNRDEFDLNRIISDKDALPDPCGTYIVREPKGLMVSQFHPQRLINQDEYHELRRKAFKVLQGQTVQIVDFHDGIAKLARNAGYIVARRSQLDKVGASTDKSCRLEGFIDTVLAVQRRNLQSALDENRQLENRLRKEINLERKKDPGYPITTDVETKNHQKNSDGKVDQGDPQELQHMQPNQSPSSQLHYLPHSTKEEMHVTKLQNISRLEPDTENITNESKRPIVNETTSPKKLYLKKYDMPICNRSNEDDLNFSDYGCGMTLFGDFFSSFGLQNKPCDHLIVLPSSNKQRKRLEDISAMRNRSSDRPAPKFRSIQRRKKDQFLVSQQKTKSTLPNLADTEINFRTGMSGHRALSKSCTKNYTIPFLKNTRRMMSQHQGIGTTFGPIMNTISQSNACQ